MAREVFRSNKRAPAKLNNAVIVICTSVIEAASIFVRERSLYANEAAQQTVESSAIRSPVLS